MVEFWKYLFKIESVFQQSNITEVGVNIFIFFYFTFNAPLDTVQDAFSQSREAMCNKFYFKLFSSFKAPWIMWLGIYQPNVVCLIKSKKLSFKHRSDCKQSGYLTSMSGQFHLIGFFYLISASNTADQRFRYWDCP